MALIQFSDISAVKDVSYHLEDRATQYINEAEFIDLKPLLGERFYYDVVSNASESGYNILVNGGNYDFDGISITCPGLKKVLIEYAYARIVFFGNDHSTPFGLVEKVYQDGKNVERGRLKEIYKATQQIAYQYWLEVKLYLERNVSDFPKYDCSGRVGIGQFKLRHIR